MADGYLVTLGDSNLDPGDAIDGPLVTFTIDSALGAGSWTWSGTWGGTTYTNELETGQYYLAADGNVYFVSDFGSVDTLTSASATTAPTYTTRDGVVTGTSGDDVIDSDYTGDDNGDVVDGNDALGAEPVELNFNWSAFGDETDLTGGVSQDTGGIQVDVSYSNDGAINPDFSVETTNTTYIGAGESLSQNSSAYLFGEGSSDNATITVDFSSVGGSGYNDEVENVQFRINDIDGLNDGGANNFQDIISITAFDADGNPVPVTIIVDGDDTLSGNTVTGNLVNHSELDVEGSILIQIAGPVAQIVIDYDNGGTTTQAIYISDIEFDAVPVGSNDDEIQAGDGNDIVDAGLGDDIVYGGAGNDTLTGGVGADILDGGTGDDIFYTAEGDTATGGDGDDFFTIVDNGETGSATLTIVGGEGNETAGDSLDFNGLLQTGSIVYTNTDDASGGLSGTATLLDGTTVNFSEIENIICFVQGTRIQTNAGLRAVQDLSPGDLIVTRDNGLQPIQWIGNKTVRGHDDLAPIRIKSGMYGATRDLLVSPQHRMLQSGWKPQMLFGDQEVLAPAKHLINGTTVAQEECDSVTYFHLLLPRHEIIFAENAITESFFPGDSALSALDEAARQEIFALFPELRSTIVGFDATARLVLNRHESLLLVA